MTPARTRAFDGRGLRALRRERHILEAGEVGIDAGDLERVGDAAPHPAKGGQAGDVLAVESDPAAGWLAMRPEIRLTKVVLPAPFGPMTARISPGSSAKVDIRRRPSGRRSCGERPSVVRSGVTAAMSHSARTVPRMPFGKNSTSSDQHDADDQQIGGGEAAGDVDADRTSAPCRSAAPAWWRRRRAASRAAAWIEYWIEAKVEPT